MSDDLKRKLTPEQYRILRQRGTEQPFSGKHLDEKRAGTYMCAGCGSVLFYSDAKFDSGCGWPARFIGAYEKLLLRKSLSGSMQGSHSLGWPTFDRPSSENAVEHKKDLSHFMVRTEVLCPKCDGHLGHVFDDGPTDTGKRYCINSAALDFTPG